MPFYLAFKELWRNKGRFLLISLVIALITTLVLFIAGLAEGLAAGNREYLSKLDAQLIVLQGNSNLQITSSRIGRSQLNDIARVPGVAAAGPVGFSTASLVRPDGSTLDVALIGVEPGLPGDPPAYAGRGLSNNLGREVVVDRHAALRAGLEVGDNLTLKVVQGTEERLYVLPIAGISDSQQYFLQPAVFVPYFTWDKVRPKGNAETDRGELIANIVAVRLADPGAAEAMAQRLERQVAGVEAAGIQTVYEATPGYAEQQSTLNTQQVFTLLIGVLVVGGFFQIQTLQKVPQIGMLKAIGAANSTVAIASIVQITAVALVGVLLGAAGTAALSLSFPPTFPIVFTGQSIAVAITSLLLIGPLGGLVSIRYSVRIEPLKALGLST
jgi:putative ABC transport system permease protein